MGTQPVIMGSQSRLRLKYGGPDPKGTSSELIVDCLKLDPKVSITLAQLDVLTMGDLTTPGTSGREWMNKKKLQEAGLSAMALILDIILLPPDTPNIRVG